MRTLHRGASARRRPGCTGPRYGNYGLHAKLYVFEIGLFIDDAALAGEVAGRIDAMMQPEASFHVVVAGDAPSDQKLTWETEVDHHPVRYSREPSRGWWQNLGQSFFRLLPLHHEL